MLILSPLQIYETVYMEVFVKKYIEPIMEIVVFENEDALMLSFQQDDNELPLNDLWD